MLHAIKQKKTSHYRRYLGYRDESDKSVREEDEISSIFLGPLDFMEPKLVLRFWTEVFQLLGRKEVFQDKPPQRHELQMWPSRAVISQDRKRIEPDAHITFFWADSARVDILIEFKWRAPLSSKDQLHRQWQDYLSEDERKNGWHVFIAPEISAGIAARNGDYGDPWRTGDNDRLILVSWAQIVVALSKCQDSSVGLSRWAAITTDFLEKIGIRRFMGFEEAHRKLPVTEIFHQPFYSGLTHDFNGFGSAIEITPESKMSFKSFFKE